MPERSMDHAARRARAAARCREMGVAALLLAPGSDLTYLSGYRMGSSERLTCLVLASDGTATLVLPELEAPRAAVAAPDLAQRTWAETADPYALAASLAPASGAVGVSDQMWAAFALRLQAALPGRRFFVSSEITRGLRTRTDPAAQDAPRAVSAAADPAATLPL